MSRHMFTSESVTEGHPDKLCDQISDAVLDEMLANDPNSRVACECITTTGLVVVMGEITTNSYVNIQKVVRDTIKSAGYTNPDYGFDSDSCAVITAIDEQSPDIALGVNNSLEYKNSGEDEADRIGAGDQGIMFGYACDETEELMPAPIYYAHKLTQKLAEVRKDNTLPWVRPDGKSQVTVQYGDNNEIERVEAIVVSTQHDDTLTLSDLRGWIKEYIIDPVIPKNLIDKDTKIYINPTGRFVYGGPRADSGLTGRKIIVDTYGGYAKHGGGAFSGKDPTKVDRSASYMARYVAKNIVAAGFAKRCEIELGYAIGVAQPVSILVDTFGTGLVSDEMLLDLIKINFDFRPASIISFLDLRRPIYKETASYGHFGRNNFSWENTDWANNHKF